MEFFVWISKAGKKKKKRLRLKVPPTYKQLEALSKQMGNAVTIDLAKGIKAFKRRASRDDLLKAFEAGDYMATLRMLPWDKLPEDLEDAVGTIGDTAARAGGIQLKALPPNVNKHLRFDPENPAIKAFLARRAGALITAIEESTRDNVREIIASSFRQAQTPRQLAERVKSSVGLLPKHEQALSNYRNGLVEAGKPAKEVERLAGAYEDKLLDYRAMMIARTETKGAIVNGQLSVWREGVKQGFLDREKATKEWVKDGAPCPICEDMDGTQVGIDDVFDFDGESVDGPPGHPNCQCSLILHFGDEEEIEE